MSSCSSRNSSSASRCRAVSTSAASAGKWSLRMAWARAGQASLPAGSSRIPAAGAPADELLPRIGDASLVGFQRAPDQRAQLPLGQTFRQRINRHNAVEVNEVFRAGFDDFRLRMVDRARFQRIEFAENKNLVARLKIFLHERQIPPAAVQSRRAVVEDELEHRSGAAAPAFDALRDDLAAGGARFAHAQFGNRTKAPSVFMAPRPMQQQIADGAEFQSRELGRAFRADAAQRGQRGVEWIGRRIWHDRIYSGPGPTGQRQNASNFA